MQMASTSSGVATLEAALVTSATLLDAADRLAGIEAAALRQPEPTRPVGRRHLPRPERLDLTQPYGGGGCAHEHLRLADPELARRQPLLRAAAGPQLEPAAGVGRPGAGRGGAGPDPPVDGHRRL